MNQIYLLWIVSLFSVATHAAETQVKMAPLYNATQTVDDAYRRKITPEALFYSTLGVGLSPLFGVGAKYKLDRYIYIGLHGMFGSLTYGQWMPSASTSDATPLTLSQQGTDPQSEFNRTRSGRDKWSVMAAGPRLGVEGRLFHEHLSRWSESGDFGINYARFTDQTNHLNFSGALFSFNASVHYHFSPQTPWSFQIGLENDFGWVGTSTSNLRRLPVRLLLVGAGIGYAI